MKNPMQDQCMEAFDWYVRHGVYTISCDAPENGRGFLRDADGKMQEDASNPSQKTKGDKMSAEHGFFGKMKFFSGKLLSYAKQKRVLPCKCTLFMDNVYKKSHRTGENFP